MDDGDNPATLTATESKNGTPAVLTEHIIRNRDLEKLLESVELNEEGLLSPTAISSLEHLFAYPVDVFEMDQVTWSSSSIRGRAIEFLQMCPPDAQRQWNLSMKTIVDARLRKAVKAGSRHAILQVSREFPLTEAGMNAAILAMTMDLLSGRILEVRLQLSELERQASGVVLASFFWSQSQPLRQLLDAINPNQSSEKGPRLSVARNSDSESLSPPWPKPIWKWSESVWNYPDVPQPVAGNTLENMIPDLDTSLKDFPNWPPVFWGSSIVHRSPFRIVAFDKQTGKEQWTITTNTFTPDVPVQQPSDDEQDELNAGYGGFGDDPAFLAGLTSFGILSCDDEYLYFVDQFDFFRRLPNNDRFENRRRPRNRLRVPQTSYNTPGSTRSGTALVALRRPAAGQLPTVAWVVGDQNVFTYNVTESPVPRKIVPKTESELNEQSVAPEQRGDQIDSTAHPLPLLDEHRFLAPPVGRGEQLFVLTIKDAFLCLNCLERHSGRVEWQQPLTFADDLMIRYHEYSDPARVCSICLLSNDVVVCSLSNGLMVGVRSTDGQLLWASAVREEPRRMLNQGFGLGIGPPLDMEDEPINSPAVMIPFASNGIVVCSNSDSANLFGINITNGEILWQTSRRAFGPGDIGGSPDHYIAGISGNQVIVIGERHCRSVDLKTGVQNWAIPMQKSLGRAECGDNKCLIPLADGRIAAIDLTAGQEIRFRPDFQPENAVQQFGAIASDADMICTSTPVSLSVYPRADSLFRDVAAKESAAAEESDRILQMAQAYLINGDDEKAIDLLKTSSAIASNPSSGIRTEYLQKYLGELILQDWGSKLMEVQTPARPISQVVNLADSRAQLLPELSLSPEQELRAAVLTVMSRPDSKLSDDDFRELTEFQDWKNPVAITDSWRIRPDLLLDHFGKPELNDNAEFEKLTSVQLKRFAANVVLFPKLLPTEQQKQALVKQLISAGHYSAAEAFLIVWADDAGSLQALNSLNQLRERKIIGGFGGSDMAEDVSPEDAPKPNSAETATKSGLTSAAGTAIELESEVFLETPDWDLQRIDRGLAIRALPDWMSLRYFLVDGQNGQPDFVSLDMSDGSLRDRVTLPFPFHRNTLAYQAISNGRATPALLPVAGTDQLAMISAVIPGKARLLWTRRLKSVTESATIEFGPMGASHLIWHHGDELHCSHPVTGQDLWIRKLQLSPVSRSMTGVRRIFGDENTVIVMGADHASFERFNTRDGRSLGNGRLSISLVSESQTVGRFLLYPDHNSRLHMFDGATGEDRLADSDPIVVGRTHADSAFHVLPEGRVLTVSSTFEIILIDTNEGRIVFRTPAASHIKTGTLFGFTAFERNGFLFVGLEEERNLVLGRLDVSYRVNEPRVSAGPLLCMDKSTGDIRWSMPLLSTSIPTIFGDPTDLLVMWSNPELNDEQLREKKQQTLDIQVVDSSTGEILARKSSISSSRPSRCSHLASEGAIELLAKDAKITIRAAATADEVE